MDRELVLAVLVAVLCGGALVAAGWWPARMPIATCGRVLERRAWRRLWLPLVPAALLFAALCGWASGEPAAAERVPTALLVGALPFGAVVLRAVWRAGRSATSAHAEVAVGTVGLVRPRIIISPRAAMGLDAGALAAAVAHERAHMRHRDPLRLWLAQLGSDLCYPWPQAAVRFRCWRQALELARDEEARFSGIPGPDLAAAILASLKFHRAAAPVRAASMVGDATFVKDRIARLMQPLEPAESHGKSAAWVLGVGLAVVLALLFGTAFGERVVRSFLLVA